MFFSCLAVVRVGSFAAYPRVNGYTRFTKQTRLGGNTHFNGLIIRGGGEVAIGDNFHSGQGCLFLVSFHKYDGGNALPYDSSIVINKNIAIGENVWLGDRVTVLGGVSIADGAIIQAGAVVSSSIPFCGVAGGNPAVVFKYRDVESYRALLAAESYV